MITLPLFIQLAGVVQFIIAAANFFAPAKLHYAENLRLVSPIVRQIFIVHSTYIVIVLVGLGLLCLLFTSDLYGASALGKGLGAFLAFFWSLRAAIQFFYYDRAIKQANPSFTLCFGIAFLALAMIFGAATFHNL